MLQENNRISWGDCVIERTTNQYYHESTVYVNEPSSSLHGGGLGRSGRVYSSDRERMESFGLKVQKHLVRWKDSLCHQWYADLEETYTAILDRENISEDIISRGQYFTASGNIIDADEIVV